MNTVGAPGPIVAGVDGSEPATQAVGWAAVEARDTRCLLRLVHAMQWPLISHPLPAGLRADWAQVMHEEGSRWLRRAEQAAELAAPGVQTQAHLFAGDPRQRLLTEAEHARELVVGSRGLGGFTGLLLGSTSAGVVAHAPCPVVVVRGPGDPAGPVVVGLDGSAAGDHALRYAFDLAARTGAALLAVHARSDTGPPWPGSDGETTTASAEAARRVLTEQLAGWPEKYPEVGVQRLVTREWPVPALLELGTRARTLVVGSRGRGGFTGLLLGSVSRALVNHAPCPVSVVRP